MPQKEVKQRLGETGESYGHAKFQLWQGTVGGIAEAASEQLSEGRFWHQASDWLAYKWH